MFMSLFTPSYHLRAPAGVPLHCLISHFHNSLLKCDQQPELSKIFLILPASILILQYFIDRYRWGSSGTYHLPRCVPPQSGSWKEGDKWLDFLSCTPSSKAVLQSSLFDVLCCQTLFQSSAHMRWSFRKSIFLELVVGPNGNGFLTGLFGNVCNIWQCLATADFVFFAHFSNEFVLVYLTFFNILCNLSLMTTIFLLLPKCSACNVNHWWVTSHSSTFPDDCLDSKPCEHINVFNSKFVHNKAFCANATSFQGS